MERSLGALSVAALLGVCAPAAAQVPEGFALDRFHAPPSVDDGIALELPRTLGAGQASTALTIDHQVSPLESPASEGAAIDIVAARTELHFAAAFGLAPRLQAFASMPITIDQTGDPVSVDGTRQPLLASSAVGDPAIGFSAWLLGRERGAQLGVSCSLLAPLGSGHAYTGDESVGARATVLAAHVGDRWTFSGQLGIGYRPDREILGSRDRIASEAELGVGARFALSPQLSLLAEVRGATSLRTPFARLTSPAEILGGVRYVEPSGLTLALAAGPGLTRAVGEPELRVLATIGFASPSVPDQQERSAAEQHDEHPEGDERDSAEGELGHRESDPAASPRLGRDQ